MVCCFDYIQGEELRGKDKSAHHSGVLLNRYLHLF